MSLSKLEGALDYQQNYERKVGEAVDYLNSRLAGVKPQFGVVLGSGLGELASSIEDSVVVDYADIPNFPKTGVKGHEGKLIIGKLAGVPVIGLKGRKHFYEVADAPFNTGILQVVFPVHVLAGLNVPNYFVTNAAGGLNSKYQVGDLMVLKSHINLLPSPLLGRHLDFNRLDGGKTWRFQPMNGAYDSRLREFLFSAGAEYKDNVHQGTYLAVTGPTFETEGECIAFRDGLNADAVGMSTTIETIVARNRGMKVVGMSCITNKIAQDGTNATNHEEVNAILESSQTKNRLSSIVKNFFEIYARDFYVSSSGFEQKLLEHFSAAGTEAIKAQLAAGFPVHVMVDGKWVKFQPDKKKD